MSHYETTAIKTKQQTELTVPNPGLVSRAVQRIAALGKKDIMLTAALMLALISACFVPPDKAYLHYIDWKTLLLLFSLMAVMAGLQKQGFFLQVGTQLLRHTKDTRQMLLVLVFLPFFFSMFITNDVALITFVPFGITVLRLADLDKLLIPLVVMQTVAANLGSMLTPMGNPQNLYLYAKSGMTPGSFLWLMLPYTVLSGLCLLLSILFLKKRPLSGGFIETPSFQGNFRMLYGYLAAFLLCLLSVANVLRPVWVAAAILLFLLITDRKVLAKVDYSLLLTFIGFFIFIDNMSRMDGFRLFLTGILNGHETIAAALSSQIISNVPAALLLSGFSTDWPALIVGTNLGGLGTLIASMASLISYKQIAREYPLKKTRYLLWFSAANIAMLVVLLFCSTTLSFL